MEGEFLRRYTELEREFVLILQNEAITAQQSAVLSNKLLQFCGGAVYSDGNMQDGVLLQNITGQKSWVTLSTAKIDALKDIIEELELIDKILITIVGLNVIIVDSNDGVGMGAGGSSGGNSGTGTGTGG